MITRLPTYFLSHGGGPWPWLDGPFRQMFNQLEQSLKDIRRELGDAPRAALVISGHWEENGFATRARLRVVALQGGDEATFAVWQRLVAQSKRYYNAIYSTLGISLTDDHIAGESSYDAHLAQLCQELEEAGIARVSDGAPPRD